jgi:hypothetical protein
MLQRMLEQRWQQLLLVKRFRQQMMHGDLKGGEIQLKHYKCARKM